MLHQIKEHAHTTLVCLSLKHPKIEFILVSKSWMFLCSKPTVVATTTIVIVVNPVSSPTCKFNIMHY